MSNSMALDLLAVCVVLSAIFFRYKNQKDLEWERKMGPFPPSGHPDWKVGVKGWTLENGQYSLERLSGWSYHAGGVKISEGADAFAQEVGLAIAKRETKEKQNE